MSNFHKMRLLHTHVIKIKPASVPLINELEAQSLFIV